MPADLKAMSASELSEMLRIPHMVPALNDRTEPMPDHAIVRLTRLNAAERAGAELLRRLADAETRAIEAERERDEALEQADSYRRAQVIMAQLHNRTREAEND